MALVISIIRSRTGPLKRIDRCRCLLDSRAIIAFAAQSRRHIVFRRGNGSDTLFKLLREKSETSVVQTFFESANFRGISGVRRRCARPSGERGSHEIGSGAARSGRHFHERASVHTALDGAWTVPKAAALRYELTPFSMRIFC